MEGTSVRNEVRDMQQITTWDGIMNKLTVLSASAKYDVACTSSGVERKGDGKHTGSAAGCGICHSFAADVCMTVSIVLTASPMMCLERHLHQKRFVLLPWNFIVETILKVCF